MNWCNLFLVLFLVTRGTYSAPQQPSETNTLYNKLLDMILLRGPFASADPTVNDVTLDVTKEFFKHKEFVTELTNCFDLFHNCKYPGMELLIETLGQVYIPGKPCPKCPPEMDKIVAYSQDMFQGKYRSLWQKFLHNVSDFFGTLK